MSTLYLIHGFIGSGKTTFSKRLAAETGAVRFTAHEWIAHFYSSNPPQELFADYERRVKEMIWSVAETFLTRGQDVILDYGFWKRSHREAYRQKAKTLAVLCSLYSMDSDYETCRMRALKRTAQMPDGELYIDDNAFQKLWKEFEPVEAVEDAVKIYI